MLVSGYYSTVHVYDGCSGAYLRDLDPAGRLRTAQAVRLQDGLLYAVNESKGWILRYRADTLEYVDTFIDAQKWPGITGVAFGPDGDVYLGGYNSSSVERYDGHTGAYKGTAVPAGAAGVAGIDNGLVFGPDGKLYVPGFDSNSVVRWDPASNRVEPFIASGSGGLYRTRGILFERDGNGLLVTSEGSKQILRYHRDGRFDRVLANMPADFGVNGIDYGPQGELLVTGYGGTAARVLRVDARSGAILGELVGLGSGGLTGATFLMHLPEQVAAPDVGNDHFAAEAGQSLHIGAAIGVLANDSHARATELTASIVAGQGPQHGGLSLSSDGAFSYTPHTGFIGSDHFSYQACIGSVCARGEVDLSVSEALRSDDQYLWQVPPASNTAQQGFIRLINRETHAGEASIWGIDARGKRSSGTLRIALAPQQALQFNSQDAEFGNVDKGLEGALGQGEGNWTLIVRSSLALDALAYIRTPDGFVTSMHDRVEGDGADWFVPMFNPGSNGNQVSWLRVINTTLQPVSVQIAGVDDAGAAGLQTLSVELPPLASREFNAIDLEEGNQDIGLLGQLGDGAGKWRLTVSASGRITVQSLLADPLGYLTNLSTFADTSDGQPLWMVTPAAETQQQGFLRLTNLAGQAGSVTLWGIDDSGQRSAGTATLSLSALQTQHINSQDLEYGNPGKGLSGSLGSGVGNWRVFVSSELDLLTMGLIRTPNGFVTTVHDTVLESALRW
ncbi:MAG TPA: Ig-like domain-containing protein, partial [Arenimonas sp.]|nr:Ig-like domain-containing protein [Arenimonas sp.]